jgi:hypothetical protein
MDTDSGIRWLVAIVAAVAIVALVVFARGGAERGNPDPATSTVLEQRA